MNEQSLEVTFLDQTGAKSVKAKISPTVQVKKILPNIITKMSLPVTAPDGTPMSYSLDHKEGGKRLQEGQTLPEAGVKSGDHLIVFPEITAGGRPPVVCAVNFFEYANASFPILMETRFDGEALRESLLTLGLAVALRDRLDTVIGWVKSEQKPERRYARKPGRKYARGKRV